MKAVKNGELRIVVGIVAVIALATLELLTLFIFTGGNAETSAQSDIQAHRKGRIFNVIDHTTVTMPFGERALHLWLESTVVPIVVIEISTDGDGLTAPTLKLGTVAPRANIETFKAGRTVGYGVARNHLIGGISG